MSIQWNSVTWYSKIIALILFVLLPFVGFYYGVKIGEALEMTKSGAIPSVAMTDDYYSNPAEWQTDQNNAGKFSIAYPIDFDTQDNPQSVPDGPQGIAGQTTAAANGFVLDIPRAFEPHSNFLGAALRVAESKDPALLRNCTSVAATTGEQENGTTTINGVVFSIFKSFDAGAGNLYDTVRYRTVHNAQCYEIAYVVHSTHVDNYPPEYGVRAFDDTRIKDLLDRVAKTFKFL